MATGKALDGKPHMGSSHMRFDGKFSASSEGLAIMRFKFSEAGTLYVTGLDAFAGNLEIPMPFENCTGLDNVSKWNLIVNGESGRRYHAKARSDGIVITAVGTLLIVK